MDFVESNEQGNTQDTREAKASALAEGASKDLSCSDKYSWEDILTMFGGFKYFSKEHLLCLYHRVNGREDEAKVFQAVIDEEAKKVRDALKKMLSPSANAEVLEK